MLYEPTWLIQKNDISIWFDRLVNKFNKTDLQCQGNEVNLIKTKTAISVFMAKLPYKLILDEGYSLTF